MKILLTGKDGQIGWELQRTLAPLGELVAFGRRGLDLADLGTLSSTVRALRPDVIVNAAAYTAVDQAQGELDLAMRLNAEAPGVLAQEAARSGALLVHISTDYVFDGRKNSPYVEDDAVNPINSYGLSKLAGETAVREAGGRHLILRTSWIYAARGKNFLRTILRLAREREELRVVSDQIGAPTWSRLVAEAIAQLVVLTRPQHDGVPGTYHLTTGGETSWYGFAREAIAQATKLPGFEARAHTITPIDSSDYPLPALRPLNSRLSNAHLESVFGVRLPDWQTALRLCLEEAAQAGPLLTTVV